MRTGGSARRHAPTPVSSYRRTTRQSNVDVRIPPSPRLVIRIRSLPVVRTRIVTRAEYGRPALSGRVRGSVA